MCVFITYRRVCDTRAAVFTVTDPRSVLCHMILSVRHGPFREYIRITVTSGVCI